MIARCERCGSSAVRFVPDAIGRTVETCERRRGGCGRTVTISGRRPGDVLDALEAEHAAFVAETRETARGWVKAARQRTCDGIGHVRSYTLAAGEGTACLGNGLRETAQAPRCQQCTTERNRRRAAARRAVERQARNEARPLTGQCGRIIAGQPCNAVFRIAPNGTRTTLCRPCARAVDNAKKAARMRERYHRSAA